MNELFDKLILRVVFALFLCLILVVYKYLHSFLYPSSRQQIFKKFIPSKNPADTIHFFARIIGIGILFGQFNFYMSKGIVYALLDFFLQATSISVIYLISIYILESIVLYNFEYSDEILKRKNMAYSIISFSQSLGIALLLRVVLATSQDNFTLLIFLWLLAMVMVGLASKTFGIISKLSFNRLLVQKSIGLSLSYLGFFWGWITVVASSLEHELTNVKEFSIQVVLKIILSLLIIPLLRKGIHLIFQLKEEFSSQYETQQSDQIEVGYGLYEGATFFTCCYLATIITGQIHFGTFYPGY